MQNIPLQALVRAMPWVFVLIWSTGFIVARYGMPYAPPLTFLAWRYVLSIACFLPWILLARAAWPTDRRQWWHLAVAGVLMHAGYLGGVWSAVKLGMTAGTVALIVGLQPVLTAGFLAWRGHAVSWRQWCGLALGFGGLMLVVWPKVHGGAIGTASLSLGLSALVCITVGTLYQKRFCRPTDVRTASSIQLGAALIATLPLAWLESEPVQVNLQLVGAMAWSVVGLTLGGSSLLFMLLQRGAATRVTSLLYLVPPCTAAMGWLMLDEAVTAPMLVGMAMTAVGVGLVVRATPTVADSARPLPAAKASMPAN